MNEIWDWEGQVLCCQTVGNVGILNKDMSAGADNQIITRLSQNTKSRMVPNLIS